MYIIYLFIFWDELSLCCPGWSAVAQSQCNGGMISAHYNLHLLGSSYSPISTSQIAGIIGACHQAQLIFVFFLVEMGFHPVGQAGLEILTSSDPPALASQSVGITGVSNCAQPLGAVNFPSKQVEIPQPVLRVLHNFIAL